MLDADTTLPPVASCRDAAGLTRFLSDLWAAVGRSEDLAYLARVIDQCEHRIGRSAAEMCHFYVLRGEALLRVKELVGHGGWLPWLAENTGYSPRQAQKYMRAARHRERLANAPSGTHLNGLLDLLVERDDDPGPDGTIRAEVGPVAEPEPLPAVEIQATEEDERPRAEPGRDVRPAPVTLSTGEVEWHTPADILEAVRLLWDGGIDLDPASSNTAQETVRARTYYTKDDDGLTRPWFDHVFLNPPYDAVAPFVAKLLADIDAGRVSEAVLLVHARTSTRWFHAVLSACDALCFASKKIRFLRPDGSVGDAPTDGSVFFYFGSQVGLFRQIFGRFGSTSAEPVADDDPALSSDGHGAARGLTLPAVVDMVGRGELTARAAAPDLPPEERRVLKALHNEIKLRERAARRAERVAAAAAAPPNPALRADRHRLHRGVFRELAAELGPSSVDCIITDPPYPREHLPFYDALGEIAARVLKPGGRLLVMIDQSILREALNRLHPSMGETVWTLCYEMPGASVQKLSPATKIHSDWKPVLYYANGENTWDFVRDTVQGGGTDKRFHGWQQDVPGFEELVRRFTVENELIFDPFACTATTGVAALHLGRRFVGAEVDPAIIGVASERLRLAAAGLPDELPEPVEAAA